MVQTLTRATRVLRVNLSPEADPDIDGWFRPLSLASFHRLLGTGQLGGQNRSVSWSYGMEAHSPGNSAEVAPNPAVGRAFLPELPEPTRYHSDSGQVLTCLLSELRPHPSYVRLRIAVSASKLSALAEKGELAFREPLAITRERIVIDGYARWELARLNGRLTLPCVEYELTEEETLRWLIQKHRRSNGMNDFCRILLALELEPLFKEKALSNQRLGGRMKGSSTLTEAAAVDVRKETATAAGVSVGNVTKVKHLVRVGHPELLEALRGGEVSIHRAWKWSKESPGSQIEALRGYRSKKGVNKAIRDLISRHKQKQIATQPDLGSLARQLSELELDKRSSVNVSVIRVPGKAMFVTEELVKSLRPYEESTPLCTDNR
jgi:hypothetical protein